MKLRLEIQSLSFTSFNQKTSFLFFGLEIFQLVPLASQIRVRLFVSNSFSNANTSSRMGELASKAGLKSDAMSVGLFEVCVLV